MSARRRLLAAASIAFAFAAPNADAQVPVTNQITGFMVTDVTHNSARIRWASTLSQDTVIVFRLIDTCPDDPNEAYTPVRSGGTISDPVVTFAMADSPHDHTFSRLMTSRGYCFMITDAAFSIRSAPIKIMTMGPPDTPPVVTAGSAQTGIAEGASVTLTGTATPSADSVGDNAIASTIWEQVTAANGNTPVAAGNQLTLTGANTLIATFTAPADLTADATYYFRLSAMDGTQTGRAWTSVMVTGVDADARISLQTTPAATRTAAGLAVTVTSGDDITARATATDSDTDVGDFTYAWTQTISATRNTEVAADAARMVMLMGDNTPQLSFTAPELFVDADGNAVAAESEGAQPASMGVLYFRLVIAGGCVSASGACEQRLIVTVQPPSAGGEAVNNAVLPHVLRNTTHGIHNSIFQRIQQRQREDGRWK